MNIILNGNHWKTDEKTMFNRISYESIVTMAGYYPGDVLTVTYSSKDHDGSLINGQHCKLSEGMIFNVFNT